MPYPFLHPGQVPGYPLVATAIPLSAQCQRWYSSLCLRPPTAQDHQLDQVQPMGDTDSIDAAEAFSSVGSRA